jgi:membrane associated rhomboid family serine protease
MVEGKPWTLVTAIFVHASFIHLLGNMVFLYVFGNTLEVISGSRKMLFAFFLGGLPSANWRRNLLISIGLLIVYVIILQIVALYVLPSFRAVNFFLKLYK